jgi:nucleoside-diphosphate-sugar epimerase
MNSFKGRHVLILGAGGFIGFNLAMTLASLGAEVHAGVRVAPIPTPFDTRFRIHNCDVVDQNSLARAFADCQPDIMFNLVAPRGNASDWNRLALDNILAAIHLIDLMLKHRHVLLVVAGSSLEYGHRIGAHREDEPLAPGTWHGIGKASASWFYGHAAKTMHLSIVRTRIFHAYGPWESPKRLVPQSLIAAVSGMPLPLTSEHFQRDWIYVQDVVDGLIAAANPSLAGEVFNLGTGTSHSSAQLVVMVEKIVGRPIRKEIGKFNPSVSDTGQRLADISLSRTRLGWYPRHDLQSGLEATLEWYRCNPNFWNSDSRGRPAHA